MSTDNLKDTVIEQATARITHKAIFEFNDKQYNTLIDAEIAALLAHAEELLFMDICYYSDLEDCKEQVMKNLLNQHKTLTAIITAIKELTDAKE